jgi:hypothetical protein
MAGASLLCSAHVIGGVAVGRRVVGLLTSWRRPSIASYLEEVGADWEIPSGIKEPDAGENTPSLSSRNGMKEPVRMV